jgi:hypothetical protein
MGVSAAPPRHFLTKYTAKPQAQIMISTEQTIPAIAPPSNPDFFSVGTAANEYIPLPLPTSATKFDDPFTRL